MSDLSKQPKEYCNVSTLYLVATPIGNREDISSRALRILKEVDIVYAEDTRHSRQLLFSYGIEAELRSLHQHNEKARADEVLQYLEAGKNLALISDAGMPSISDPGLLVVSALQESSHNVVVIPGASAVVTALAGSGLSSQPFTFFGFPPDKKGKRASLFEQIKNLPHTLIFYVAIHDLKKYLQEISEVFSENKVSIARELTKMHEQFYLGTATELLALISSGDLVLKGELVLLIDNTSALEDNSQGINRNLLIKAFADELPSSKLAKIVAKLTNENRQDVYAEIEKLKSK